jgi:ABC-type polysaccharide/polyol phosphate export permease
MDLLRALLVTTGSPEGRGHVTTSIAESERWRENRPTNGRRALDLQELWAYRELIAFFALRDIKVRYKQAVFGGAWALVQPLAGAAIFTVVFGRLADLPSDGIPYLVFAFAGFTLWTYFSSSLNTARASLVSNAPLITKVYFPRLAAPVAGVLPGFVDLAASLPLLALMMLWTGTAPTLAILASPWCCSVRWSSRSASGCSSPRSPCSTGRAAGLRPGGAALALATPVAYSSSLVEGPWRAAYYLNPMVGVMDGWRWSLLGGPAPGWEVLISAAVALAFLVVGARVFSRSERQFADLI